MPSGPSLAGVAGVGWLQAWPRGPAQGRGSATHGCPEPVRREGKDARGDGLTRPQSSAEQENGEGRGGACLAMATPVLWEGGLQTVGGPLGPDRGAPFLVPMWRPELHTALLAALQGMQASVLLSHLSCGATRMCQNRGPLTTGHACPGLLGQPPEPCWSPG